MVVMVTYSCYGSGAEVKGSFERPNAGVQLHVTLAESYYNSTMKQIITLQRSILQEKLKTVLIVIDRIRLLLCIAKEEPSYSDHHTMSPLTGNELVYLVESFQEIGHVVL